MLTNRGRWIAFAFFAVLLTLLILINAGKQANTENRIKGAGSVENSEVTQADFDGAKLGGVVTSLADDAVKLFLDGYFGIESGSYTSFEEFDEARLALDGGRISAMWVTDVTADYLVGSGDYEAYSPKETPGKGQERFEFAFAFAPENESLRDMANAFLKGEKADSGQGTLVIGIIGAVPPLECVDAKGNPGGRAYELAGEFAAAIGCEAEFVKLSNATALVNLMAGKVDMLAAYGTSDNHSLNVPEYIMSDGYQTVTEYRLITLKDKEQGKMNDLKEAISENLIAGGAYSLILKAVVVTAVLLLVSLIVAVVSGFALIKLGSQRNKVVKGIAGSIAFLGSNTPVILLMLLIYYGVFGDSHLSAMIPAALAIGIFGAGMIYEKYYGYSALKLSPQAGKRSNTDDAKEDKAKDDKAKDDKAKDDKAKSRLNEFVCFLGSHSARRILLSMLQWTTVAGYLGVNDVTKVMQTIGNRTLYPLFSIVCSIIFYLAVTVILTNLPYSDGN